MPIDRYYIEQFLGEHAGDIRGRVLEIGDDSYTRQFGGDQVTVRDVLHVTEGNPLATFVGDLTQADHIPSDAFDCFICTQTLHLIFDVQTALRTIYRILKPGGVLLATFPGISQRSNDEWAAGWYWSFTTQSARRMFTELFPVDNLTSNAYGNVLTATAFLQGLAVRELTRDELDYHDSRYEQLISVRAKKPEPQR
jgi:SAM-dependent methyltransferase